MERGEGGFSHTVANLETMSALSNTVLHCTVHFALSAWMKWASSVIASGKECRHRGKSAKGEVNRAAESEQ
jgi:hypothetical protein